MNPTVPDPQPLPAFERLLLPPVPAAAAMGISPRLLFSLTKSGAIPVVRINRRTLYDPADLRRYIAARKGK